jgi:hypothetical protein
MGIFIIVIGVLIIFISGDGKRHRLMPTSQKRQVLIGALIIVIGLLVVNSEHFPDAYNKKKSEYKYPVDMKNR